MSANVIPFPEPERRTPNCQICEHSISDGGGTYCRLYREEILFEDEAEECPEFEDDPHKA